MNLSDCYIGQRVGLHPATDLWMQGARYGTVVDIVVNGVEALTERKLGFARVNLDAGRMMSIRASDLIDADEIARWNAAITEATSA